MRVIQNKYSISNVNFLMRLIVCLMIIFVSKPIFNILNIVLDDSEEISLLMDTESLEEENNTEELEEIEEFEKILQANCNVILHQETKVLVTININLCSEFECKLIVPPPEFS